MFYLYIHYDKITVRPVVKLSAVVKIQQPY